MNQPFNKLAVTAVDDLAEGIDRLYDIADAERSLPLLVVPALDVTRDDLGLTDSRLIAIAAAIGAETPGDLHSSKWRGGPVLAVGLEPKAVHQVTSDPRVRVVLTLVNPNHR